MNNARRITISALAIALYVVIMYYTQAFSFGQYQIRIATALYSLAYFFPFLVFPLGLANFTSNLLGGMGLPDMLGGFVVGVLTAYTISLVNTKKLPFFMVFFPILIIPGCGVPIWLSRILNVPYAALAVSLCIGQIVPAVMGVILVKALEPVLSKLEI